MLQKMQTRWRESFKAHLTSHPMSFIRHLTHSLSCFFNAKHPIGEQRKKVAFRLFRSPPSPLPLSIYCDDRRFADWCEHNGLYVKFIDLDGGKKCNRI